MENDLFSKRILVWYYNNKRELPWRHTTDPYTIWLSEVIMQQTRIDQGTAYFLRFIDKYPTVVHMAHAKEEEILKLWQGLGYYSRARNLYHTAQYVNRTMKDVFPSSYNTLMELKGIGPYTAAAISSICSNEPIPAIDGNGYRVLSRIFGIDVPIDTSSGQKQFKTLAFELIDHQNPGDFNQAVMDFGAQLCSPQNPECNNCPFQSQCHAFLTNSIKDLPKKRGKIKQTERFFNYLVIRHENTLFINKREKKDIWLGLYDFPMIETTSKILINEINEADLIVKIHNTFEIKSIILQYEGKQKLTHQTIHASFYEIEVILPLKSFLDFTMINKMHIFEVAIPKIVDTYLEQANWT